MFCGVVYTYVYLSMPICVYMSIYVCIYTYIQCICLCFKGIRIVSLLHARWWRRTPRGSSPSRAKEEQSPCRRRCLVVKRVCVCVTSETVHGCVVCVVKCVQVSVFMCLSKCVQVSTSVREWGKSSHQLSPSRELMMPAMMKTMGQVIKFLVWQYTRHEVLNSSPNQPSHRPRMTTRTTNLINSRISQNCHQPTVHLRSMGA